MGAGTVKADDRACLPSPLS